MKFSCEWKDLGKDILNKVKQTLNTNTTCSLSNVDHSFESLDVCD